MYIKEINPIIIENMKLNSASAKLINEFYKTGDIQCLNEAEEILIKVSKNHRTIERMRGEN